MNAETEAEKSIKRPDGRILGETEIDGKIAALDKNKLTKRDLANFSKTLARHTNAIRQRDNGKCIAYTLKSKKKLGNLTKNGHNFAKLIDPEKS